MITKLVVVIIVCDSCVPAVRESEFQLLGIVARIDRRGSIDEDRSTRSFAPLKAARLHLRSILTSGVSSQSFSVRLLGRPVGQWNMIDRCGVSLLTAEFPNRHEQSTLWSFAPLKGARMHSVSKHFICAKYCYSVLATQRSFDRSKVHCQA